MVPVCQLNSKTVIIVIVSVNRNYTDGSHFLFIVATIIHALTKKTEWVFFIQKNFFCCLQFLDFWIQRKKRTGFVFTFALDGNEWDWIRWFLCNDEGFPQAISDIRVYCLAIITSSSSCKCDYSVCVCVFFWLNVNIYRPWAASQFCEK